MKFWEYKRVDNQVSMCENELNEHGRNGWELVAVFFNVAIGKYQYIFKRPF